MEVEPSSSTFRLSPVAERFYAPDHTAHELEHQCEQLRFRRELWERCAQTFLSTTTTQPVQLVASKERLRESEWHEWAAK
jgi:hypothetical protein